MKPYTIADFREIDTWLIFGLDAQVKNKAIDIYMVLDLPSNKFLAFETVPGNLSEKQAEKLLQQSANKKGGIPKRIIMTKGDPAEPFINVVAQKLKLGFQSVPAWYLENLIAPIKESFGSQFFSMSSIAYTATKDESDALDWEAAKSTFPDSYDLCPCASGKKFKFCCKPAYRDIILAMAAAEDGKFNEAMKWLNNAKSILGETAEIYCREAIIYSIFNDTKKSDAALAKCLKLNPKHARAFYLLGIDLKKQGDLPGAIAAYEKAINNYPSSDHYHLNEVYNNLGNVYYEMANYAKAKAAWEKAFLYLPADKVVRQNLSECIYNNPLVPKMLRENKIFTGDF